MAIIKIKRGTTGPSGLTAGEPAFDTALDKLFVHDGSAAVWVGAEILNDSTLSANSATKIPTQQAVKTYVDNNLAAGAVTSVDGITGAVGVDGSSFIGVNTAGKTLTITNLGVQTFNGSTGAVSFVNYVASAVAGNQITVSSATGNVTIGVNANPSFTTLTTTGTGSIGGNLTVTGNLTVNGTTTTVNSDVMTVDDPMIVIGLSGGLPLTVSDGNKDRGIAFTYFDGSAGRTGFYGYDASANEFVFQNRATISSDVSTGVSYANARIGGTLILNTSAGVDSIVAGGGGYAFSLSNSYAGELVAAGTYPSTGGYILKSNNTLGSPSQPTWIDPSATGFTAFAATRLATARNIALTGNVTATGVAFDGTAGITLTTVIPSSTVTNAMLVNSGFTLGSTGITLGSTTTSISGLSSVAATTFTGALSGNASTATALQTARTFSLTGNVTASGITFDGTGNVALSTTIGAGVVTNAMLVNSGFTLGTTNVTLGSTGLTLAGLSSVSATTFTGALSGNASTATALQTARTFSLTGNVTASGITFDGTGNVALSTTIGAGVVTNAMLQNSGFTLGTTNITLGSTGLTLAGLSSVSATTFTGSLSGTATTATNVVTTEQTTGTIYLVGATAASSSIGLLIDATATTPLSYNIATGTITCVQIEAMIDGGNY